ncbi:unnamed protein product [Paramecium primaurelia]|uniref:Uncharacterized protein n=2 Tax=Paramecium TaxID=5884 RepID=A0A8S1XVB1_9CILI|nr:unnamed protein product [Paramecium primaurelia]CAD8203904.1 unnamed protein product [Paramecium pentaurelia]
MQQYQSQPAFNPKHLFTMKKYFNGYVQQNRFFHKKTETKSDSGSEVFKEIQQLPQIVQRIDRRIENVNYKYKSAPMIEKKKQNSRKLSFPVLKYSPTENKVQLQKIKDLIEQHTSRVIVKDDMLKHMIGYSKISQMII